MYVIIVGGGKVGLQLARALVGEGAEVLVIEADAARYNVLQAKIDQAVIVLGDGTSPKLLRQCGIERADVLVAVTGRDEVNFVAAHLAKKTFNVPRVVSRVNNPANEKIFTMLGLGTVINSTNLIMSAINHELHLSRVMRLLSIGAGNIEVADLQISEGSQVVGKRIDELQMPSESAIFAIIREGATIFPRGDTVLQPNDSVLIALRPDKLDEMQQIFGS